MTSSTPEESPEPSAVRRLFARLRGEGWGPTLRRIGRWARLHLIRVDRTIILVKRLDEIVVPRRRDMLVLEDAEARHLPALRRINRSRNDLKVDDRFARDIAAGYGGFVAFAGGEPAGCYWWVDRKMRPVHRELTSRGLGIELGPRDVYGFDLFLLPEFRGGGRASDLAYQVESRLRDRGFERLLGGVDERNLMARWLYDSRGYEPVEVVVSTTVLGYTRQRHEPLPPAAAQ